MSWYRILGDRFTHCVFRLLFGLIVLPLIANADASEISKQQLDLGEYQKIKWQNLLKEGWDPGRDLLINNIHKMSDDDPLIEDALNKVRISWDKAPINKSVLGAKITLMGLATSVSNSKSFDAEFLLRPSVGTCAHNPDPPANQTVLVKFPGSNFKFTRNTLVSVSGTIHESRKKTKYGVAAYIVNAIHVELVDKNNKIRQISN